MGDTIGTSVGAGTGTLGIAGVGLIGGSIAAAAKARGLGARVIGFGRSIERLEAAARAGLIDEFATDYSSADNVDFFVSCVPVDRIAESIREAARRMRPGTVATDAGSAKAAVVAAVGPTPAPGVTFVGSHPLAGSERQGFEHADADLFVGRTCVVTPTGDENAAAVSRVTTFWQRLGSRVVEMLPAEHDQVLARTSHLPHIAAAAVAAGLCDGEARFAASGFRDVTRVAGGDPDLWTAILLANRKAVSDAIEDHVRRCREFASAIAAADAERLRRLLADAKARRDEFAEAFK